MASSRRSNRSFRPFAPGIDSAAGLLVDSRIARKPRAERSDVYAHICCAVPDRDLLGQTLRPRFLDCDPAGQREPNDKCRSSPPPPAFPLCAGVFTRHGPMRQVPPAVRTVRAPTCRDGYMRRSSACVPRTSQLRPYIPSLAGLNASLGARNRRSKGVLIGLFPRNSR